MKKIKKVNGGKKRIKKPIRKQAPKSTRHEIVVRVENQQQPTRALMTQEDLSPEVKDSKYTLINSWVAEKQVIQLVQKTPEKYVLSRKGRGGQEFDYVPGHYFRKVLNFTFAWNWDFEIVKQEVYGIGEVWAQVITTGKLTVKDEKGHFITKMDNGKADIKCLRGTKTPMDLGNDFKASATDALKRCCVQFGIAGDVYGKAEIKHDTNIEVREARSINALPSVIETKTVALKKGQVIGPDGKPTYLCSVTGDPISDAEYDFSMKLYGKPLSREAQKGAKSKR